MRRTSKQRGWTLVELLMVLFLLGVLVTWLVTSGGPILRTSKITVCRQQAKAVQGALETWVSEQPTLYGARQAFNATAGATTPTDQLAFFNANLAGSIDSAMAADIAAHSSSTRLGSTMLDTVGGYMTIYWDANYNASHAKVQLVIP